MFRLLLCLKSSRYIIQEYTADDTASAPHTGNGCQIEIPAERFGRFLQHGKTLCIGYQFRSIQSGINIFHQFRLIIDHL